MGKGKRQNTGAANPGIARLNRMVATSGSKVNQPPLLWFPWICGLFIQCTEGSSQSLAHN